MRLRICIAIMFIAALCYVGQAVHAFIFAHDYGDGFICIAWAVLCYVNAFAWAGRLDVD